MSLLEDLHCFCCGLPQSLAEMAEIRDRSHRGDKHLAREELVLAQDLIFCGKRPMRCIDRNVWGAIMALALQKGCQPARTSSVSTALSYKVELRSCVCR